MPHFKDKSGGLFWLDDGDVDGWKSQEWQGVSEGEAEAIREDIRADMPVDRRSQIAARMAQIDAESIRALRAVARGKAVKADADKLGALETEAEALRMELAAMGGS